MTSIKSTAKYRTTNICTHLYFSSEQEMRELYKKYFRILDLGIRSIPGKSGEHQCIVALLTPDS
jgi:hypothetical protein